MIPLPKFKELLGPEAIAMTDEEVGMARETIYQLVEIAFDFWQQENGKTDIVNSACL
jgi:hypothetical protein